MEFPIKRTINTAVPRREEKVRGGEKKSIAHRMEFLEYLVKRLRQMCIFHQHQKKAV
jgi:hypothetical protein